MMNAMKRLTDGELLAKVNGATHDGRRSLACLLSYIGEVDVRRLYVGEGFPNLFTFVQERLGFSDGETARRVHVSRLGRKHPLVLRALADGKISLTSLSYLAPILDSKNVESLVSEASGKSTREVQEIVVRLKPLPELRESVRRKPVRRSKRGEASENSAPHPEPGRVKPSASGLYHVKMTIDTEHRQMIEEAKDLGEYESITEMHKAAMALFLESLKTKKYGKKKRSPAKESSAKESPTQSSEGTPKNRRYIPRSIAREVFERDQGRCTYRNKRGERCPGTRYLQLDHYRVPFALGGNHSLENLTMRCAAHNQMTAKSFFGEAYIRGKIESAREART